jgi:DNA-binding response OmpR family regulator
MHPSRTVLIVEDDDDMAALMRLVLEKDGWTVHRAADGKGAKELMRRLAPPELVTLDIFLPDASGVDLILNVRDTPGWERVPIVMVTAKPKDKEVNWAIKSGATAYLVKPFRQEELRDCVRRVAPVQNDSDAIERAVYDGMQDLRADKSE